jgi:hypothetical protein
MGAEISAELREVAPDVHEECLVQRRYLSAESTEEILDAGWPGIPRSQKQQLNERRQA